MAALRSPNIGVLRSNDRPCPCTLHENLHHDTIPRRSRCAVGILVAAHSPSDVRNGNIRAEKLDVGSSDRPHRPALGSAISVSIVSCVIFSHLWAFRSPRLGAR
jgi:hypothetical protein